MKKLVVRKVDNENYQQKIFLADVTNSKEYTVGLCFIGLELVLELGDRLFLNVNMFDKSYAEYSAGEYYFGNLDENSGRKIDSEMHHDLLIIERENGEQIRLKRLFG